MEVKIGIEGLDLPLSALAAAVAVLIALLLVFIFRFFRQASAAFGDAPIDPISVPPDHHQAFPEPSPQLSEAPAAAKDDALLPARVLAIDVETTGLGDTDRIVSFGAVMLETASLAQGAVTFKVDHLVFDPGKKSHPGAERVHGWDDWTLRHQDKFSDHAEHIIKLFENADLIVAHNLEFDMRFIRREVASIGRRLPAKDVCCTMMEWRKQGIGSATLHSVASRLGHSRQSDTHGAAEDALLALIAWLGLHRPHLRISPLKLPPPTNLRDPPPQPGGPLPRRQRRQTNTKSAHIDRP
jgi:DNA polymerase III subunit epsilon